MYEVKVKDDASILTHFDGALLTKGVKDPLESIRRGGAKARKKRLHQSSPTIPDTNYDGDLALPINLADMIA